MARRISVRGENFIDLRNSDSYYVDKTELLYDLIHEKNNVVTLFTRPRRFGKTLTMSMIESFLSIFKFESRSVFNGLDIIKRKEFCDEHMNQYPVLFISLKDVEALTFESAYRKLTIVISDLCKKFIYLEYDKNVIPSDAEKFHKLQYESADYEDVQNALKTIMRMMYSKYGKQVVLLIDEYDVPLAKAQYGHGLRLLSLILVHCSLFLSS